jgi:branched-chain amino acid aminotransferase
MIYAAPRPRGSKTKHGISVQVSAWRRMSDNAMPLRIKCGANYVNARLARFQAQADGYDDAVMLNETGKISEGPRACLFVVRRGRLVTPDVASGILESITRDTILELACEAGQRVEERALDRTELYAAEEASFVGSAAEVLPIVSADGISIGDGTPGPVTHALQAAYFSAVVGDSHRDRDWLTPVYGGKSATA